MKSTVWIFSIEPLDTRYTGQWHTYLPKLFEKELGSKYNIVQVDGVQKNTALTPGAFLNFSDTNYWKSTQLCKFLEQHNQGMTSPDDHFVFTDAWNPTVVQLKYMSDLLGFNWTLHGLWHAGSYDPQDFLGRLVGNIPWVRHAEKSFFHSFDHDYFATNFHIELFMRNLLNNEMEIENPWFEEDLEEVLNGEYPKIIRTGWPMEYMEHALASYKNMNKRDLIIFPHRIAPEKQVEIFRDLAVQLPQYEFVVCQDKQLTKDEYYKLLGESKIVFSANLQETLGISCYEGAVVDAIPMVPDRLSYKEMYYDAFRYDSKWTENYDVYTVYKSDLCRAIIEHMDNYSARIPLIKKQAKDLSDNFFNASKLFTNIKDIDNKTLE